MATKRVPAKASDKAVSALLDFALLRFLWQFEQATPSVPRIMPTRNILQ